MKKILFTAFLFFAGLTATFAQANILREQPRAEMHVHVH